jgi:hypothetical protein
MPTIIPHNQTDPNRHRRSLVLELRPQTVNRSSSNCFPKLASQRLDAASAFRRDADASQSAPPTDSPSPRAFKISDKEGVGEGAGDEAIKKAASRQQNTQHSKAANPALVPTQTLPAKAKKR